MRKRVYIVIFLCMLLPFQGQGQQLPQYSQWSYNQFTINPALAGVKKCLEVRLAARAQWLGLKGAPKSGLLTINAPLNKKNKRYNDFFHGIGGSISEDNFGPFNNFSVNLAYALHFPLGRKGEHLLSFGASVGVGEFSFDASKATVINPDPAVNHSVNHALFPIISFGGFYYSNYYYVGVSIEQLAKNKWKDIGFDSRFRLHTKISFGGKLTFNNNNSLIPGMLIRIPPAGPVSMDINLMFDFKNTFDIGVGYRNVDALIAFLKLKLGHITVGYSFDYITSSIRGGNYHTHELSIQYSGCFSGKRSQTACPVFQ